MTDQLQPNHFLSPGECLISSNGKFQLEIQPTDGNLVLSGLFGRLRLGDHGVGFQALVTVRKAIWASNTPGSFVRIDNVMVEPKLFMQDDGNLVLRINNLGDSGVLFKTNTQGHPGSHLEVQNDGNLVVYDVKHHPIWATGTENPV